MSAVIASASPLAGCVSTTAAATISPYFSSGAANATASATRECPSSALSTCAHAEPNAQGAQPPERQDLAVCCPGSATLTSALCKRHASKRHTPIHDSGRGRWLLGHDHPRLKAAQPAASRCMRTCRYTPAPCLAKTTLKQIALLCSMASRQAAHEALGARPRASMGEIFSPPRLMSSLRRPVSVTKPSSSRKPWSPVWNQPPARPQHPAQRQPTGTSTAKCLCPAGRLQHVEQQSHHMQLAAVQSSWLLYNQGQLYYQAVNCSIFDHQLLCCDVAVGDVTNPVEPPQWHVLSRLCGEGF